MKKAMIYAYTRFNFGDDLFIKILCDRYPDVQFRLYTFSEYKNIFSDCKNLKIYSYTNPIIRIFSKIGRLLKVDIHFERLIAKSCDFCVYIGGSLFMQTTDFWQEDFKYISRRYIEGRPFYLLGANFGPYMDENYYLKYKELFSSYTDICFREIYSLKLFKDLPNVRQAADIVFTYKDEEHFEEKNQVVISVLDLSNRNELEQYATIYYQKIAEICKMFSGKNIRVLLVSFCRLEHDEEAIDAIYNILESSVKQMVDKVYYRGNINEIVSVFQQSKFIIATRFHAMILGWILGKTVLPIVYSEKMQNVINDIGSSGDYIRIENIHQLNIGVIENCFENNQVISVDHQRKNAEKQFEKLDIFLGKNEKG